MDERELTQLLRRAGERVTPGPAPVDRIIREGDALRRQQRHGRVVLVRAVAIAAAVVGGGSLAATVVDFPSLGGADSATSADAGGVSDEDSGAGGGEEAAGGSTEDGGTDSELEAERERATEDSLASADAEPAVVSPGDVVVVRDSDDPGGRLDGVWRMERRVDDGWVYEYRLGASFSSASPTWSEAGEALDSTTVRPILGPARLVVPPVAAAGEYRVCEEQGGAEARCAFLTVRG